MEISIRAKERFCKDCNIPLKLVQEPYFTDRLRLYDKFYDTLEKWELFQNELGKYQCEQDYFEEYNRVKDAAIMTIKDSEAYQRFTMEDMNQFCIKHKGLIQKDIFKPSNDGKRFISIDMRKANFSSLHYYDSSMFQGLQNKAMANTWEEFIQNFTDNKHIINSKYIRQVILGNCNPKRHITYEKYLMDMILSKVTEQYIDLDRVVFFSNDEIIFQVTDLKLEESRQLALQLSSFQEYQVPVRIELFTLTKIKNTDGYCKWMDTEEQIKVEFKCLDNYMIPFVMRAYLGEEVTENDKIFYHEGLLAKFIEIPEIEIKQV